MRENFFVVEYENYSATCYRLFHSQTSRSDMLNVIESPLVNLQFTDNNCGRNRNTTKTVVATSINWLWSSGKSWQLISWTTVQTVQGQRFARGTKTVSTVAWCCCIHKQCVMRRCAPGSCVVSCSSEKIRWELKVDDTFFVLFQQPKVIENTFDYFVTLHSTRKIAAEHGCLKHT